MTISQRFNQTVRKVPPWVLYVLAPIPAAWWFYQGLTGALGAEPINALERQYGEFALQLLIFGLAITPLRKHLNIDLVKFRRAIGLIGFGYVAAHLAVWLFLDVQILSQIWADISETPLYHHRHGRLCHHDPLGGDVEQPDGSQTGANQVAAFAQDHLWRGNVGGRSLPDGQQGLSMGTADIPWDYRPTSGVADRTEESHEPRSQDGLGKT